MRNTAILVVLSLFANIAFAGLPPTTTKGQLDLKGVTTFNYQFPGYPITHTGTTASIGTPSVALPNYVGLDATWANTQVNDRGAEATLGNWAAYKNTVAGVSPDAGMTGGTPSGNVLLTRTTAAGQVLDGAASFLITKGAFNVQGEGFSVIANVPPAFRTQSTTISIPFKVISGNYVQGDLKVFLYDVTNSQVITPFNNDVVGSQGVITAIAQLSTNTAQIRVGFHFASTSASALTIAFDDVSVGPNQAAMGLAGGNVRSDLILTPSTGFGSYTNLDSRTVRTGDRLSGNIFFITGSVVNAVDNAYILLPAGLRIDASKYPTGNHTKVGDGHYLSGGSSGINTNAYTEILFYDGVNTDRLYFSYSVGATTGTYTKLNVGINYSPGVGFQYSFRDIAIAGYDANVNMAESSTFKISSYLANGTRVTTTPTKLGEYRALIKTVNSYVADIGTWTDTAPTNSPNASGVQLFGVNYTNAGTAGSPNAYQIFIGKNLPFYKLMGVDPSGSIDDSPQSWAFNSNGIFRNYDPSTGVITVAANVSSSSNTGTVYFGAPGFYGFGYVDVQVSQNALAVGVQAPRSEVFVTGTAGTSGYGSSASNKVIVFANQIINSGTGITYISDPVNGDSFLINESGLYSVTSCGSASGGQGLFGITRNYSTLTAAYGAAPGINNLFGYTNPAANLPGCGSASSLFSAGETIRAVGQGGALLTSDYGSSIRITKVNN